MTVVRGAVVFAKRPAQFQFTTNHMRLIIRHDPITVSRDICSLIPAATGLLGPVQSESRV